MKLLGALSIGILACTAGLACAEQLPACSAQPFADESAASHELRLRRVCGGEHARWNIATPRLKPADAGPGGLKAQFTKVVTRTLDDWRGTLQMDWAGTRAGAMNGLRTERATLGASTLLRLDDWAFHVKFGRELAGLPSTRATVASLWQPTRSALVFAEWAGSHIGTQGHRLGARWWPVPGLMAFDFAARQLPGNSAWVDQRVSLTLQFRP